MHVVQENTAMKLRNRIGNMKANEDMMNRTSIPRQRRWRRGDYDTINSWVRGDLWGVPQADICYTNPNSSGARACVLVHVYAQLR